VIILFNDCLIELACAIVECAVDDLKKEIPSCEKGSFKRYLNNVDSYLKNKNSAERFFKSKWYSELTLGRDGHKDLIEIRGY